MERLKLSIVGGCVVSAPCHQDTLVPFETDGLMNGGAVQGGMPWFIRYAGEMPLLGFGNVWVRVNPMLWVDPLTAMRGPEERAYDPLNTNFSFGEYANPIRGPNAR